MRSQSFYFFFFLEFLRNGKYNLEEIEVGAPFEKCVQNKEGILFQKKDNKVGLSLSSVSPNPSCP